MMKVGILVLVVLVFANISVVTSDADYERENSRDYVGLHVWYIRDLYKFEICLRSGLEYIK